MDVLDELMVIGSFSVDGGFSMVIETDKTIVYTTLFATLLALSAHRRRDIRLLTKIKSTPHRLDIDLVFR